MKFGLFNDDEEGNDFELSILFDDEFDDEDDNWQDARGAQGTNKVNMSGIKPPKPLVVNSDIDMSLEWNEWLELYENYFIANKLNAEDDATIQVANFKACIGRDALKVLNNLNLTEAEKRS